MVAVLVGLLVVVSALGDEATHPIAFLLYRTLLFAIACWCARAIYKAPSSSVCPRFLMAVLVISFLMLQSLVWSPGTSFEGLYRWYPLVLFGAAFVTLAAYSRNQPATWKSRMLYMLVGIQVVYLLVALAFQSAPITGGFINPNYFASFLLVGFSACIALSLFRTDWRERAAAAAGAMLLYYGMTQASSRGATLVAVGVTMLALLRYRRNVQMSRAAIAAAMAILILAAALASPRLVQKFTDFGSTDPYNYLRPQLWLSAIRVIQEDPVLGVGLGQFVHVSRQYAPPVEETIARYAQRPGIAHSEYLQYAAETGIPVTLLFLTLAGYLGWLVLRRARTCSPEFRVFQEAAVLAGAALAAHALVDNNWTVPVMAAGIVVFSLADILPYRDWKFDIQWTAARKTLAGIVLFALYAHSTLIPAAAFWFNRSGHAATAREDFQAAESAHRIAAAIAPDHPAFLNNTGAVYLEMYLRSGEKRRLALAEDFFLRAIEANPRAEAPRRHLQSVLVQRLTGSAESDRDVHMRIAEVTRDLLRIDPFNPFVRKNLAEALYNVGMHREAEDELKRALEFEPNYVPGYLRLAEWHLRDGNPGKAEHYRQKASEVVARYQNFQTEQSYETLLLGRSSPSSHP